MIDKDLVIIGGGAAGLASAISAFDNGIKDILIIERDDHLGGILHQCIHNGFGLTTFKEELTGPEYAQRYIDQIKEKQIKYVLNSQVISLKSDKVVTYSNEEEGVVEVKAKAIILATGSYERGAGAINLPGSRVAGILTAGTVQKYINLKGYLVGKRAVIVGSGDIGLIMARRLTLEGVKVLCVSEIMPYSNGLNRNIVQCLNDFNIPLKTSMTVTNVIGKKRVEKIVLSKIDENKNPIPGTEEVYDADLLVLSVGLIPYTTLLDDLNIHYGRSRGAVVNDSFETEIPGLFCCGNCLHIHDLVDYVSLEGNVAGKSAAKYILGNSENKTSINVVNGDLVNYVVPNKINIKNDEDVSLKFRVSKPLKECYIVISGDNKVIKKIKMPSIVPSIMQNVTISKESLSNVKEVKVGILYE